MQYEGVELEIDPIHEEMDLFNQELTVDIWNEKYCYRKNEHETHPTQTFGRVIDGVYQHDPNLEAKDAALDAMCKGLWCPGGRIIAGAGTPKVVTLLNCYVIRAIPDSMVGISEALQDSMLTMQQGGGIGMDFSTLRPSGAFLERTQAVASGPLPFMDMWDSMCGTIMSAGSRRGAMMAVMHCEHPDLPHFIQAKKEKGRLTNFNVSVLVTDAFMEAVSNDEDWYLNFPQPREDGQHLFVVEREHGPDSYVYSKWKARELWDLITYHTYEYSEPGVIFIDRINDYNNLAYCEDIIATNPCGEQPLPANGCCNLGAVNLARMVRRPFQPDATFDYDLLSTVTRIGMRFLDNVIDVSGYPLEAQAEEERNKRRTGLGVTGLGDALMMLRIHYGSEKALQTANSIMETIKNSAYDESAELARERGPFPLYDAEHWGKGSPVVQSLNPSVRANINKNGIRNGVLLTIAPTGTTSVLFGNVSSGLEPVFAFSYQRKVLQPDGTRKEYTAKDYGYAVRCHVLGEPKVDEPPDRWEVTAQELSVEDHTRIQSVCQRHICASISKTINCPADMTFEDFKLVYWDTYALGCKGCTTYRPSDVRGSVLSVGEDKPKEEAITDRPDILTGTTYKIKWPHSSSSYYVTINDYEGTPFEIFITSTNSKYQDWTTALSLMISAIMRKTHNLDFIPEELEKVVSVTDFAWVRGKFYGSLVARIGEVIRQHIHRGAEIETNHASVSNEGTIEAEAEALEWGQPVGQVCPQCNQPTFVPEEGCMKCKSCGFSNCG